MLASLPTAYLYFLFIPSSFVLLFSFNIFLSSYFICNGFFLFSSRKKKKEYTGQKDVLSDADIKEIKRLKIRVETGGYTCQLGTVHGCDRKFIRRFLKKNELKKNKIKMKEKSYPSPPKKKKKKKGFIHRLLQNMVLSLLGNRQKNRQKFTVTRWGRAAGAYGFPSHGNGMAQIRAKRF